MQATSSRNKRPSVFRAHMATVPAIDTPAIPAAPLPAALFEPAHANSLLRSDNFAELHAYLQKAFDAGASRGRYAVDWAKTRAIAGHVLALYMVQRNRVKHPECTVLSTLEMTRALEVYVASVIRVHEDAAACKLGLGEDHDFAAKQYLDKLAHWWAQHEDWVPLSDVMSSNLIACMKSMDASSRNPESPQPTWLLTFSGTCYIPGAWGVSFGVTPADKAAACRKNPNIGSIRTAVRDTLMKRFREKDADWATVQTMSFEESRKDVPTPAPSTTPTVA